MFLLYHTFFSLYTVFFKKAEGFTELIYHIPRENTLTTEKNRALQRKNAASRKSQARSGAQHEPCIEHSIIQSAPLYVSRIATQSKSYHAKYIASCIVYRTAKLHRSAADGTPKNSVRKHHECCRIRQAPQESKKDAHLRDTRPFL